MAILDLTQTLSNAMLVYPGADPPTIRQAHTIDPSGYAEKWLSLSSHTGTHIDAPAHMLPGGPTLDALGMDHFLGQGCAVDVSNLESLEIGVRVLEANEAAMEGRDFVLFHTGWSKRWGQMSYFSNFPTLSQDGARWMARRGLKGVGFDTLSVDPVDTTGYANHLAFFRTGMILIENLKGLDRLIGKPFLFSCLPLNIEGADGSPVRAVAVLD